MWLLIQCFHDWRIKFTRNLDFFSIFIFAHFKRSYSLIFIGKFHHINFQSLARYYWNVFISFIQILLFSSCFHNNTILIRIEIFLNFYFENMVPIWTSDLVIFCVPQVSFRRLANRTCDSSGKHQSDQRIFLPHRCIRHPIRSDRSPVEGPSRLPPSPGSRSESDSPRTANVLIPRYVALSGKLLSTALPALAPGILGDGDRRWRRLATAGRRYGTASERTTSTTLSQLEMRELRGGRNLYLSAMTTRKRKEDLIELTTKEFDLLHFLFLLWYEMKIFNLFFTLIRCNEGCHLYFWSKN